MNWKMTPSLSINNVADGGDMNPKFFRKLSQQCPKLSLTQHGFDLNVRKFSVTVILAALVICIFGLSAFRNHVVDVIGIRPKEQVIGVNAKWVIALVKDVHVFGSRTSVDNPRRPVSDDGFTAWSPGTNVPVTAAVFCGPSPRPATTEHGEVTWNWPSLIYLRPESFQEVVSQPLLFEILFGRFVSHNQSSVVCATLRAALTAPRHFHFYSCNPTQSTLH